MSLRCAPRTSTIGGIHTWSLKLGKSSNVIAQQITVSTSNIKIVTQGVCPQVCLLILNYANKESWHQYSISLHLSVAKSSSWRMPGSYIECPALGTGEKYELTHEYHWMIHLYSNESKKEERRSPKRLIFVPCNERDGDADHIIWWHKLY